MARILCNRLNVLVWLFLWILLFSFFKPFKQKSLDFYFRCLRFRRSVKQALNRKKNGFWKCIFDQNFRNFSRCEKLMLLIRYRSLAKKITEKAFFLKYFLLCFSISFSFSVERRKKNIFHHFKISSFVHSFAISKVTFELCSWKRKYYFEKEKRKIWKGSFYWPLRWFL